MQGDLCPGCVARDREIEVLREKLEVALAEMAVLREEMASLRGEVAELRKENARLSARLRKSSRNSSLPPSSDPPSAPKRKKKKRSGRKPGGQPGHEANFRELVPTERAHEVVPHFPERCEGCGKKVTESEKLRDRDLAREHRGQVWEIPPIEPRITEHQCHLAECGACGTVSRATLPENVMRSMFGPNLMALVVLLTGAYRMSKRNVASLLSSAFGIAVSLGTISNIEHRVTRALRVPVEILKAMVQMTKVVYADETTWKERAQRVYIWAAVTTFGAVYIVRKSRAARIAVELLGTDPKVVVTDRYKGYLWIPLRWRQLCWAHLKRDFEWIMSFAGPARRIGKELLACEKELFILWHRVRDGTLKRNSFRTLVSPVRKRIQSLLEEGEALELEGVSGMCKDMLKVYPAFYTFVRVEGVEPTNNAVEAKQRHPAIWRRVSFGTWSRRGSEYVGHILSVVTTLQIREREVLPYLRAACEAALEGKNAPLLVPFDTEEASCDAA